MIIICENGKVADKTNVEIDREYNRIFLYENGVPIELLATYCSDQEAERAMRAFRRNCAIGKNVFDCRL